MTRDCSLAAPPEAHSIFKAGPPSPESIENSTGEESRVNTGGSPTLSDTRVSLFTCPVSCALTDTFPKFIAGDVRIRSCLTGHSKEWLLHSGVLSRHFISFAQSIRESQISPADCTGCYEYVIEIVDGHIQMKGKTEQAERASTPRSYDLSRPSDINVKFDDDAEGRMYENTIKVYDQILESFYNIPPRVTGIDITRATSEAEELAKLGRHLVCIHLVASHIGNALLKYRQILYQAIFTDPVRYLLIAIALENDFIYTKSLIHLMGAYPHSIWPTSPKLLPEDIQRLIAKKSRALEAEVVEVECELLILTIMLKPRKEPHRCNVSSQFDTWFVVQLFRDTLANVLRQHDKSKPSLRRGSLSRKIKAGDSRYMVYEEVRRMVQRVMPSAVETLYEDMRILKEYASEYVKDLARNELSLDTEEHGVGWLTCSKIEKEDIPWRADERYT